MQAYHNANQPYYPQSQYVNAQPAYYTHYTPYPSYLPPVSQQKNHHPFPTGYQEPYDPQPPDLQQYSTPAPRPHRSLSRSQSAAVTPRSKMVPLKSAMKKPPGDHSTSVGGPPLARARTSSDPRPRLNSTTRPQKDLHPALIPNHLFVALHGSNQLRMDNIAYQSTVDELREAILPMWHHGVTAEESRKHTWRAQFSGTPWSSSGTDGLLARRLICRLYAVLASQGYSYLATVNTANPLKPARLVFGDSTPDPTAHFFTVIFSRSGDQLSILDAPPPIAQNLGLNLRELFPRRIASDRATEDGIYKIELRNLRGAAGFEIDKDLFVACVLRYFNSVGYKLDGSLAMGKARPLGLGCKKELWVFRGSGRRPESANSHKYR